MLARGLTILLSSFLLFLVQPIVAKQILPWFGGSAGVWSMCLLFFETVLLLGYGYAHWLTSRHKPRRQVLIHIGLLLISGLWLPIVAAKRWQPDPSANPSLQILGLLMATVGLPYFLLASTAPLLQKWLSAAAGWSIHRVRIYRFFALSNLGSLIGLLAYPFAIEPFSSVRAQSLGWSAAYVIFAIALLVCARDALRVEADGAQRADGSSAKERITPGLPRYGYWIGCASLGSALLLSLTNHMTQNIASIPFLWILPLSIYLLSFVVCFEGQGGQGWYRRRLWFAPVMLATGAMAWGLVAHQAVLSIYLALPLFGAGLFLACVFCHGELAKTKPDPTFLTQFYLSLAAGGALGGLFVAGIAPHVFDFFWETPLALIAVCILGVAVCLQEARAEPLYRWFINLAIAVAATLVVLGVLGGLPGPLNDYGLRWTGDLGSRTRLALGGVLIVALLLLQRYRFSGAIALGALLFTLSYSWNYYRFLTEDTELMVRNFYGALRVSLTDPGPEQRRRLMHGVILHGSQYVHAPLSAQPTTYYGPQSGIGRAIAWGRTDASPMRVGSIGLGTGTLAIYGAAGDVFRIYELNPEVLTIAQTRFSYLAQSKADIDIVLGDARLSLTRELANGLFDDPGKRFDVLSIDAFSSDAIPVHLITCEAFAIYARVVKPNGVIAFHTSNRYLDLPPVIEQMARAAGYRAFQIVDRPDISSVFSPTDWVLVTRNQEFLAQAGIADAGRLVTPRPELRPWTDQSNDLFEILK